MVGGEVRARTGGISKSDVYVGILGLELSWQGFFSFVFKGSHLLHYVFLVHRGHLVSYTPLLLPVPFQATGVLALRKRLTLLFLT